MLSYILEFNWAASRKRNELGDMSLSQVERRQRVAHLLQRAPLFAKLLIGLVRYTRARFSAGVVGVTINADMHILIVKHVFHTKHPWGLPGGWLDRGETPSAALRREYIEELGLPVTVHEPLLVDGNIYYRQHLDLAFRCTPRGSVQKLSAELLGYRWASTDDLPPLNPFHTKAVEEALNRL